MLYLYYGADTFSRREALAELCRSLDNDGALATNTVTLPAGETTPAEVINACNTPPFLGEHRLVMVDGLWKLVEGGGRGRRKKETSPVAEGWAPLAEFVPQMPDTTVLVLVDGLLSATNPLLADLKPLAAKVVDFAPPSDLGRWVQERASETGVKIDPRAARKLAQLVGRYDPKQRDNREYLDTWVASSELEKLSAFANGGPIREQDVDLLTTNLKEQKGYFLCDAILEKRPANAAKLLYEVLQHDHPQLVIGTISGRYRRLAIVRDLLDQGAPSEIIGREAGSSGYALERLIEQASRNSMQEIRAAYARVVQADFEHKSGDVDERVALEVMVQELATPPVETRRSATR
jgi:DNA polymerase-3 subunit delta